MEEAREFSVVAVVTHHPFKHWINNGLMAIFVVLEIIRERCTQLKKAMRDLHESRSGSFNGRINNFPAGCSTHDEDNNPPLHNCHLSTMLT